MVVVSSMAVACGGSVGGAADAATTDASIESRDGPASVPDAGSDTVSGDSPGSHADGNAPTVYCDAGDYYVTVNDGNRTQVLRSGCGDSGPSVPWVQDRAIGDTCVAPFLFGCSSTSELSFFIKECGGALTVETGPAYVTYEDDSGRTLAGVGTGEFTSVQPVGGGAAGRFSTNLSVADSGADAGSISGTFCVLHVASQ